MAPMTLALLATTAVVLASLAVSAQLEAEAEELERVARDDAPQSSHLITRP